MLHWFHGLKSVSFSLSLLPYPRVTELRAIEGRKNLAGYLALCFSMGFPWNKSYCGGGWGGKGALFFFFFCQISFRKVSKNYYRVHQHFNSLGFSTVKGLVHRTLCWQTYEMSFYSFPGGASYGKEPAWQCRLDLRDSDLILGWRSLEGGTANSTHGLRAWQAEAPGLHRAGHSTAVRHTTWNALRDRANSTILCYE